MVLVDSAAQVAERRLHRVSPDEIVHAVVFACAHEVAAGVPADRLARWRTVFLSCSFCFEFATGDGGGINAAYMKSHSLRQRYVEAYTAALQRTAKQTAHEIFRFRRMKEELFGLPLSRKNVWEEYKKHAGEAVSENFVSAALSVYEQIVSVPALAHCVDVLEEYYNLSSCFCSLSNLQVLIFRTDVGRPRRWVMEAIVDGVLSGNLCNNDITKACLSGSWKAVSLCTLLQYRRHVATRYLAIELPQLGVSMRDLQEIETKIDNHASYRAHVRGINGESRDMTWKARFRPSSILAFDLLEDPPTSRNIHIISFHCTAVRVTFSRVGTATPRSKLDDSKMLRESLGVLKGH